MQLFPLGQGVEAISEVAEKTWFVSILANVVAFETDEGLILVDAGLRNFAPQMAKELRQRTTAPVHTAIYTHGHVDHAFLVWMISL